MINVGIVGTSGYSGLELLRVLSHHPAVRIAKLFGNALTGKLIEEIHPSLRRCISRQIEEFSVPALKTIDVLFVALPSGQAMSLVPGALANGCRVIDLGGDFRLEKATVYEEYYGHVHNATDLLGTAAYGLTEWNCEAIKSADLVANPGCYPTSILLPLIPLLKDGLLDESAIAITAYSGTSGAGKSVTEKMMFGEVYNNVRAYKVGHHQHIPEIGQYLMKFSGVDVAFSFAPHMLPVARGIYTTIHARLREGDNEMTIAHSLLTAYASAPFVRIVAPAIPEMNDVTHSNFCDIGYAVNDKNLILLSTIDNLGKGAAGQAVQNMNVMFDLPQSEGLLPCFKNT